MLQLMHILRQDSLKLWSGGCSFCYCGASAGPIMYRDNWSNMSTKGNNVSPVCMMATILFGD